MDSRQCLFGLSMLLCLAAIATPAAAQDCRWVGTAPYCAGECAVGETHRAGRSTAPIPPEPNPASNDFGADCAFGSKALCCSTPGLTCRWDGTAPFCDGECDEGERASDRVKAGIGETCVTGTKVKCCRPVTGSSSQPLVTVAQALYAGIWERAPMKIERAQGTQTTGGGGSKAQAAATSPGRATAQKAQDKSIVKSAPRMTKATADPGRRITVAKIGPTARHGMTADQYQAEYARQDRAGNRLVHVTGYGVGEAAYYAAIWSDEDGPPVSARHGLTSGRYTEEVREHAEKGYRLVHVSGYSVNGRVRFAAIFEKEAGAAISARHGLSAAGFQRAFEEHIDKGYRLIGISGYADGGKPTFAAIWEKSSGPAWVAHHLMDTAQYQARFNEYAGNGYRLAHLSGFRVQGKKRYAAIWEKREGPVWVTYQGMDSSRYQEMFDDLNGQGYRLRLVSGY